MLNDDLFMIILYPTLFLFRDPNFLLLYPVTQTTTSRIVGTLKDSSAKVKEAKTLELRLMLHLRMRSNELY
jgi:hypothetical protein